MRAVPNQNFKRLCPHILGINTALNLTLFTFLTPTPHPEDPGVNSSQKTSELLQSVV
jgi:hypothetical protein